MLSVIYAECHCAECRCAECRYAECRYALCCGALNTAKAFMVEALEYVQVLFRKAIPAKSGGKDAHNYKTVQLNKDIN